MLANTKNDGSSKDARSTAGFESALNLIFLARALSHICSPWIRLYAAIWACTSSMTSSRTVPAS